MDLRNGHLQKKVMKNHNSESYYLNIEQTHAQPMKIFCINSRNYHMRSIQLFFLHLIFHILNRINHNNNNHCCPVNPDN